MSQIDSIEPPYFLTRQTANLQEDFGREIEKSASLFLLYGGEGVGKTRLLKELVLTRLNGHRIHWVDCKQNANETNVLTEQGSALDSTLDIAAIGDVIIADHFELATNKIKQQLLQSWSTDGIDKKFSLIIVTDQAGLEEVSDLATRYRLKIKGFQLLPLTRVEIDGYCASTLFPSTPPSALSMSKQTRRALNETRGVIGQLRDVVELNRNHIAMKGQSTTLSIVKPLFVVFGLTLSLVLAGLAYHYLPVASYESLSFNNQEKEGVELAQPDDNSTASVPTLEVVSSETLAIQDPNKMIPAPVMDESALADTELEPVAPPEAELALVEVFDSPQIKLDQPGETKIVAVDKVEVDKVVEVNEVEVGKVPENEPVKVEPAKVEALVDIVGKEPYSDWFKAELKRSRDWLETSAKTRAAIQLMSISLESDTDDVYLNYVEALQKKGVDVSQLRLYATRVRENILFSIIFGDYDSRRIASQSVSDLPASLRANQPISRSVGGIWNEISQL